MNPKTIFQTLLLILFISGSLVSTSRAQTIYAVNEMNGNVLVVSNGTTTMKLFAQSDDPSVQYPHPYSMVINSVGDLYIGNQGSPYSTANISKIAAGTTNATIFRDNISVNGMAFDSTGNLFVTVPGAGFFTGGSLSKIAAGTANPVAINTTGATLAMPWSLAFDKTGNLYIGDWAGGDMGQAVIFKMAAGSTTLEPFVTANINDPTAMVFDQSGNLFIASSGFRTGYNDPNSIVMQVPFGTTNAIQYSPFRNPTGLAIDTNGNLFVGSAQDTDIRKISAGSTNAVSYASGGGMGSLFALAIQSSLAPDTSSVWQTNFGFWDVSNNWVGGNIPTSSSDATITNGGTAVLSTAGYASSVTIGTASNNSGTLLISNGGTLTATNVRVGSAGTGSLTVASRGTLAASNISIAASNRSTGVVNVGTYGGTDTNVSLNAPTITFGSGTGTVNFNQADTLVVSSTFNGTNTTSAYKLIAQLGTGTTVMTGQQVGTNKLALVVNGGALVFSNAVYTSTYGGFSDAGYMYVGYRKAPAFSNSMPVSMLITSNSVVSVYEVSIGDGYIGGVPSGNASNSLVVDGSTLKSDYFYVGDGGDSNTLLLTNGAIVTINGNPYIGNKGNGNRAIVTGTNTIWSADKMYLGYSGKATNTSGQLVGLSNSLVISNGAKVLLTRELYVGYDSGTNGNNTVLVTGTNSMLSNRGGMYLGYQENGDTVTVSDGAKLIGSNDYIGYKGSNNSILVTGAGSIYTNSGNLLIGSNGSGNSLVVSNGATVAVKGGITLSAASGDTNNSVTVASGGTMTASNITIASPSGSSGVVNVGTYGGNDTNVSLNASTITFGGGTGTVNFNQADTLTNSSVILGSVDPLSVSVIAQLGSGTTVLTGQGSSNSATVIVNNGAMVLDGASFTTVKSGDRFSFPRYNPVSGSFFVGFQDTNFGGGYSNSTGASLLVTNGAKLDVNFLEIGHGFKDTNGVVQYNVNNSALITGSNTVVTTTNRQLNSLSVTYIGKLGNSNSLAVVNGATLSGNVTVGLDGSGNSLVVSNGGKISGGGSLYLGYADIDPDRETGNNNSALITGSNTTATLRGITIGYFYESPGASSNTLTIADGAKVTSQNGVTVGDDEGSAYTNSSGQYTRGNIGNQLNLSGGSLLSISNTGLTIGNSKGGNSGISNSATISGSTLLIAGQILVGYGRDSHDRLASGGIFNRLNVTSNSVLAAQGMTIGNGRRNTNGYSGGDSNSMVVNSSRVTNTGNLVIGFADSGLGGNYNSLLLTNGAFMTNSGSLAVGTNNSVTNYSGGNGNTLTVAGASTLTVGGNATIGGVGASNNTILVNGNGSALQVTGALSLGSTNGRANSLTLNNGAFVSASSITAYSNSVVTGNSTITTTSGTTLNGGTFAPTGTNALTVNGNLTFTGGTYLWNLYNNSTVEAGGTNFTVASILNGALSVDTNSVFALNFGGGVSSSSPFWTNSQQWLVASANSSLSSAQNFSLAWASPSSSAGLNISLFRLSESNNNLYLNFYVPVTTNPVINPGVNDLPSYNGGLTALVIDAPTNGVAILASNNPSLLSIVLNSGTLESTNQNSIPTNAPVTVNNGTMGFTGAGTNTIGSLFVSGGSVAASNTVVNVQSFVQTGGTLSGGTNATYWAGNYYFAATNDATVNANLANLGTVANYRSTAVVTTNSSGAPVAPVIFDNNMSYDGGTVITGGILQLGSSNSSGAVSVQGTITNNGFLNYGYNGNSTTPTNTVIGSGVIGQIGTGTLTVGSGITSSFTGSFAAANGTLAIASNSALGSSTNFYLASSGTLLAATGVTNITQSVNVTNGTGVIDNASGATLALNGTLTKSGSVLVLAGGNFDVNGQVTGSGAPGSFNSDLVISNATVTLNSGNNNYTGPTTVQGGSTLSNGIVNALPTDTVLNMGATSDGAVINRYDMAGSDQTIAGLASAGTASKIVTSGAAANLTVNGSQNTTYGGLITGNIALIRSGTGSTLLSGANTYSGGTTINSGKIVTTANTALGTGSVLLAGGTLEVRSLLTIGAITWSGGQIALPTLTSANGIYMVSTSGLTLSGGNTFNLAGASLTQGMATPLLGATNIMGYSTNDFAVTGLGAYELLLSNNILWIELLADPTPAVPAYPNFMISGLTPNQSQVAGVMNKWASNNPTGDQATVLNALTNVPSSQWAAAFDQISPRFYQQMSTIAFNLANAQNNELVQRMFGLRAAGTGFSMSGFADNMPILEGQGDGSKGVLDAKKDILRPGADTHWGMFVDANGMFGQANSGNMLPNYNFQSGGITTGLTYQWSDTFLTGLYAGYQGAYAKNSGLGTLIDNSVRFGLISTYGSASGKGFYADGLIGGGYNNYQVSRTIQFGSINRTANSSPGAGELDSMIAAGYNWKKGNWAFGPVASLQYTYFGVNGFSETGAQSLNLANQGWNASSMISSLGANCAYSWQAKKDLMVVPQINLGWQHEFMQNSYSINSTMSGAAFGNSSAAPIRDTLYTGVGVTVEFAKKWNTSFFYNAAAGNSDLTSQNIFWSAGVKF
jgi:fibronectin-binding autotransporter adhesin